MTTDVCVQFLTDKSFIMSSYNGLKRTLDKYVSENYEEVRAYANYFLTRYVNSKKLACSMLNADTCINNAYLHVLTIDNAKTDENSVKSYLLNTIKYQIIWNTSLSHKQDDINSQVPDLLDELDNDEVLDKIQIENVYNFRKWCIQKYRSEIVDPVEKRIAQVYFDDKKQTAEAMAEYFNVSRTSAHYMIRDLKQKIRKIQYCYERL
jgi:hypothetical protein